MVYQPDHVPKGPHHVYVFYDKTESRFKIGETRRLAARRTDAARDVLSWHERPTLKIYRHWTFQNYYAGIHVEQASMNLLKLHGFSPVIKPDWFKIDRATMDAAITVIDDLAKVILDWEERSGGIECSPFQPEKPYTRYVHDTDWVTLGFVLENKDGSIDYTEPDVREAIARKKHYYEKWKKKMPDALARFIAEYEASSQVKEVRHD